MNILTINAIEIGPHKQRLVALANDILQVAISDDEGESWQLTLDKDDDSVDNVNCLLIDMMCLFIATKNRYIYKSDDCGLTWAVIEAGVYSSTPYQMMSGSLDQIFAASQTILIRSRDTGNTWEMLRRPF